MLVRESNGRLFGIEDSEEANRIEPLSEEDVLEFCFKPLVLADALREANAIRGKGQSRLEGFLSLGSKRIDSSTTLRVYLAIASGEGPVEKRLRLLAKGRPSQSRVIVFSVIPNLDAAVEEALDAANVFLAELSEFGFEIDWPLSLGIEPTAPRFALFCEGST